MNHGRQAQRAAIYARISISSKESVSVERQIEECKKYAERSNWTVAGTFIDEGVSATSNRPEDRPGWRALLESREKFDVVVIWKIDRLARRVPDFFTAHELLSERGATLAAVADQIDMSTPGGEMMATMLSAFARMEAATISARVAAARSHMLKSGRSVGGKPPYGYRNVPNPNGDGKVLAQDPETIDYLRGMVEQVKAGASLYSIQQWLTEVGAPTPTGKVVPWAYSTVERVIRHPILAGMTPFNPGNTKDKNGKESRRRGDGVLLGDDGLPVVNEALAIMPVAEWRALIHQLDNRDSAQTMPRALRKSTSALLSGLVWCGDPRHDEPLRMHRGTVQGRHMYYCPDCSQVMTDPDSAIIHEFLQAKGEQFRWAVVEEVYEGGRAVLPEIEHRLDELDDLIRAATDRDTRRELQEQQADLLDRRDEQREKAPQITYRWEQEPGSFAQAWERAETVEDKRAVIDDALERVIVRRGKPGRQTLELKLARLEFTWKDPERVGPIPAPPPDEVLAAWANEPNPADK